MADEQILEVYNHIIDAFSATQNQSLAWLEQFRSNDNTWDTCLNCLIKADISNTIVVSTILSIIKEKLRFQWLIASKEMKQQLYSYCVQILYYHSDNKLQCSELVLTGSCLVISYFLVQISDEEYNSYYDMLSQLLQLPQGVIHFLKIFSLIPDSAMSLFKDDTDSRLPVVIARLYLLQKALLPILLNLCNTIKIEDNSSFALCNAILECIKGWIDKSNNENNRKNYVLTIQRLYETSLLSFILSLFSLSYDSPFFNESYIECSSETLKELLSTPFNASSQIFLNTEKGKLISMAYYQIAEKYTQMIPTINRMIETENINYIQYISEPLLMIFSEHFQLYNQSSYINYLSNIFFTILTRVELPSSLLNSFLITLSDLILNFTDNVKIPDIFINIPEYIVPKLIQYCSSSHVYSNDSEYSSIRMTSEDIILGLCDGYAGAKRISNIIVQIFIKPDLDNGQREASMLLYRGVLDSVISNTNMLFDKNEDVANDTFDMSITVDDISDTLNNTNKKEDIKPVETCIDSDLMIILQNLQLLKCSEDCLRTSLFTLFQFNDWFKCRPTICYQILQFLLECLSSNLYLSSVIQYLKQYASELGYITQQQYEQLLSLLPMIQTSVPFDIFSIYIKSMTQFACQYDQCTIKSSTYYIQQILEYFLKPLYSLIASDTNIQFTLENTPSLESILNYLNCISCSLSGIVNIDIANNIVISLYSQIDALYNKIQVDILIPYICNFYKSIIGLIPLELLNIDINRSIYDRICSLISVYSNIEVYKILYVYLSWYSKGLDVDTLNSLVTLLLTKIDIQFEQNSVDINIMAQIFHCIYHILLHPQCQPILVATLYPYIIKCLSDNMIEYYFQKNLLKILKFYFTNPKYQDPELHFGYLYHLFERLFSLSLSPLPVKLRNLYISTLSSYLTTNILMLRKLSHRIIQQLFKKPPHDSLLSLLSVDIRACLGTVFSSKGLTPIRYKRIMNDLLLFIDNEITQDTFIQNSYQKFNHQ